MCKNVNIDKVYHKWCKGFGTALALLQLYHTVFFSFKDDYSQCSKPGMLTWIAFQKCAL